MERREKPIVTAVDIKNGLLNIKWECKGVGFGNLDIIINKNKNNILGEIIPTKEFLAYTETMGKEFMEEVLNSMVIYLINNSEICE